MGLLTTYNKDNRVVTGGKTVSYSRAMIPGQWTYNTSISTQTTYWQAWEYHRYCYKTYMYVGMDQTTAEACAAAAITYYTRTTKTSFWNYNGPTDGTFTQVTSGSIPMADVQVQQVEGHMYNVVINVREEDCLLSISPDVPYSTLFAYTDSRGYDTGNNAFQ